VKNLTKTILLLTVGGLLLPTISSAGDAKLRIRVSAGHDWVYDDRDTGADDDFYAWSQQTNTGNTGDTSYYSLGHIGTNANNGNEKSSIIVADLSGDALAQPTGYLHIWDDSGSGGTFDAHAWKPIAPNGYTCLGDVITQSGNTPSTDLIRCVKSDYVTYGASTKIWDDSGSGADDDFGVWRAIPHSGDENAMPVNTIITRQSHDSGNLTFPMLNKDFIEGWGFATDPSTDWEQTAEAFAPKINLHPNEQWFPSTVDSFINNTNVVSDGGQEYRHANISCATCYDQDFLLGTTPNSNGDTPMYAMVVEKTPSSARTSLPDGIVATDSVVDINYFIFYPYNRGKYVDPIVYDETWYGNHVGDWEHYTVRFVNGKPYQTFLAQHSDGQQIQFGEMNVKTSTWFNGKFNTELYSAWGSHGLYAGTGTVTYGDYTIFELQDTMASGGMVIDGGYENNVNVVMRQDQGTYTGENAWLNYAGRWGNSEQACITEINLLFTSISIGICRLESGPTGPMDKSVSDPTYLLMD